MGIPVSPDLDVCPEHLSFVELYINQAAAGDPRRGGLSTMISNNETTLIDERNLVKYCIILSHDALDPLLNHHLALVHQRE